MILNKKKKALSLVTVTVDWLDDFDCRMLQDYHSFQPRPDGGVMCGVLHSAVPAHRGESQTHRGYGHFLFTCIYLYTGYSLIVPQDGGYLAISHCEAERDS